MTDNTKDLGRLIAAHPVAPVYIQRAVMISLLSFLFFAAMMVAFYIRQSLGYFLLATGFLVVYLITMFSWFAQRKSVVKVFQKGIEFRSNKLTWDEIAAVEQGESVVVTPRNGKPIGFPATIAEPAALVRHIKFHLANDESK
jgi:hypothetical protein